MANIAELLEVARVSCREMVNERAASPATAHRMHVLIKAIHVASEDLNHAAGRVLMMTYGLATPGVHPTAAMHTALVGLTAMREVYEELQKQLTDELTAADRPKAH